MYAKMQLFFVNLQFPMSNIYVCRCAIIYVTIQLYQSIWKYFYYANMSLLCILIGHDAIHMLLSNYF